MQWNACSTLNGSLEPSHVREGGAGKQIPSKYIPSVTREPLKETENMLEDENNKQARTITGGPLKKNEIDRGNKGKWVRTYCVVVSTGKLTNER